MELSPEERRRIYLQEKARLEVQRELQAQNKKTAAGTGVGRIVVGLFGFLVLLFIIGSAMGNSENTSSPQPEASLSKTRGTRPMIS